MTVHNSRELYIEETGPIIRSVFMDYFFKLNFEQLKLHVKKLYDLFIV